MDMKNIGLTVIAAGLALVIAGGLILLAGRLGFLGKLPGDLSFRWRGGSVFFPLASCVLLSVILTVLGNIIIRFFNK